MSLSSSNMFLLCSTTPKYFAQKLGQSFIEKSEYDHCLLRKLSNTTNYTENGLSVAFLLLYVWLVPNLGLHTLLFINNKLQT